MVGNSAELELTLIAGSDRFDPQDKRWVTQETDLIAELSRTVGGVRREVAATVGDKGTTETVILALGSAGAFGAAMECFRIWLARDRTRRIEIIWTADDREERVVLQATGIDKSSFDQLAQAVRQRTGW